VAGDQEVSLPEVRLSEELPARGREGSQQSSREDNSAQNSDSLPGTCPSSGNGSLELPVVKRIFVQKGSEAYGPKTTENIRVAMVPRPVSPSPNPSPHSARNSANVELEGMQRHKDSVPDIAASMDGGAGFEYHQRTSIEDLQRKVVAQMQRTGRAFTRNSLPHTLSGESLDEFTRRALERSSAMERAIVIRDRDIDLDDVSMEQQEFLMTPSDRFVVHPNVRLRVFLDLLVLILICIECITLPLNIAFSIQLPLVFHIVSLILFGIDMLASFTTGYYHQTILIMRRRRIVRQYVRTWFILDFVSIFPWEEIVALFQPSESGGGGTRTTFVRILKLGKLLRVLRLLRLAKISALVKRLQNNGVLPQDLSNLKFSMAVAKMFVVYTLLSHWAACIWGFIGHPDNIGIAESNEWPYPVEQCTMGGACEHGIEGSPWKIRYAMDYYSSAVQYFAALQYATSLFTGGESSMQASSPLERMFSIILMISAVLLNSSVVGEIILIIQRHAEVRMDFEELMRQARDFMNARKVSSALQVRIARYLEMQHHIHDGHSSCVNRDFMDKLSATLQIELIEGLNSPSLRAHPFFRDLSSQAAFDKLCLQAEPVIFAAHEYVVEQGEIATCAYFLVSGKVRVENPITLVETDKVVYLKPPSWVGDVCLFVETLRQSSVCALVTTETLSLEKARLQEVCEEFPDVRHQFLVHRDKILNSEADTLLCSHCMDIGHCKEMCPLKDVKFNDNGQADDDQEEEADRKSTKSKTPILKSGMTMPISSSLWPMKSTNAKRRNSD